MWCYTLLPKIWNMSLTASVVILFVLLARLLLRRAPKVFSYALWIVVLFRLLCPVSLSSGLSLLSLVDAPVSEQNTVEYIPPNIVHMEVPAVTLPLPGVSEAVNEALPSGEEQLVADPLAAPVVIATWIWMVGIAALLIYSIGSLMRLQWKLMGSALLRDNIRLADRITSPFVMGLFRPKIYLPSSLPESERDYIILHEQYHIRRGDHIVKLLAFAALCIHWFNPLVWLAFFLSGKDMEMSCDEAVLRKLGPEIRGAYSQSLLNLATGRRVIGGTPLAFGEGNTKGRIKNALKWKKPAVWIVIVAVLVCAAVIVVCALNPENNQDSEPNGPADASDLYTEYSDSFAIEAIAPGEEACYPEEIVLPWGASLEYSVAYTRMGLTMEYGLRAADGTEYRWETVGGSAKGIMEDFPAGTYTLFVRNSEMNARDTHDTDMTMTGAFWFSYKKESASAADGADVPVQAAGQADPLDAAVSAAILEHTAYENGNEWFRCESHVILGTQSSSGEHTEQLTVYAWVLYSDYNISDQGLTNMRGGSLPVALTFSVTNGDTYTLTEFWHPGDGTDYWKNIQEKFPASLWEKVDGQKYICALTQACYAQAVEYSGLDTNAVIERLFETIGASPAASSNPGDYIDAHDAEHRELLYYGDYTLRYIFSQFFAGGQTGLKGHLMRIVMCELLGGESINLAAATGQEYFDAWLESARSVREERGDTYMKEHMPKAWLLLETVDSILQSASHPLIPDEQGESVT